MLVEGRAELLPSLRKLLLKLVCLEGNGVPFVLKGSEERGNRSKSRGTRADDALGFELDQVIYSELLAIDGVGAMLSNVCVNQALLEDVSCGRVSFGARQQSLEIYGPLFLDATGTCGASPETARGSAEAIGAQCGCVLLAHNMLAGVARYGGQLRGAA